MKDDASQGWIRASFPLALFSAVLLIVSSLLFVGCSGTCLFWGPVATLFAELSEVLAFPIGLVAAGLLCIIVGLVDAAAGWPIGGQAAKSGSESARRPWQGPVLIVVGLVLILVWHESSYLEALGSFFDTLPSQGTSEPPFKYWISAVGAATALLTAVAALISSVAAMITSLVVLRRLRNDDEGTDRHRTRRPTQRATQVARQQRRKRDFRRRS